MARLTPREQADKWKRRMAQAAPDIVRGVDAVTTNPAEQAIAAKDKMVNNWNAAINSGKWERGLQNTTLAEWKNSMKTKGVQRIQAGAEQGASKYEAYAQDVQPHIDALRAEINAMPNLTVEDSIARAGAWIRGMAAYSRN